MAKQTETKTEPRAKCLEVGRTYFFQTCTKDWVGRLVSIDSPFSVTIEECSWVFDSGRLSIFVQTGKTDNMEVEFLGKDSCMSLQWVNWIDWPHQLFDRNYPS